MVTIKSAMTASAVMALDVLWCKKRCYSFFSSSAGASGADAGASGVDAGASAAVSVTPASMSLIFLRNSKDDTFFIINEEICIDSVEIVYIGKNTTEFIAIRGRRFKFFSKKGR